MATNVEGQRLTVRLYRASASTGLLLVLLVLQMLAGCSLIKEMVKPVPRVPLINANAPNRIPGQYIIVFKLGTSPKVALAAQNKAKELGGTIRTTYILEPTGFSAKLSEKALQVLREIPEVEYIEVNLAGSLDIEQRLDPSNWPKGLDRTSERGIPPQLLLDNRYTYSEEGSGVHVYVIDTGIFADHDEFGGRFSGRVQGGANVTDSPALGTDDCDGHGTHVAGIIGGKTFGIAKKVTLHPVRYLNCTMDESDDNVAADFAAKAVEWVTAEVQAKRMPEMPGMPDKPHPAVVNLSSSFSSTVAEPVMLNRKIRTSMHLPLTYVVSAGNNNANACNTSPANIKIQPKPSPPSTTYDPIVVGAINPNNDTRWANSNYGGCIKLFAPGEQILSAVPNTVRSPGYLSGCTSGSSLSGFKTMSCSGTSMAAPHVTGVVARILGISGNGNLTPVQVWDKVHHANNFCLNPPCPPNPGTMGWGGVGGRGTNSPNEMLHYGSLNNGYNDGDPHITTVTGIHYDFQDGGEFVALRDANGMEIQTRQTPVATAPWASVNTAIAARVGQHRVTWQPNISGVPDPSGLQLRVDGAVTTIGERGLDLGGGGRVMKSPTGDRLEVDFPDGTALFVASHWWESQKQWYLDVHVFHTPATEGIMGDIEQDSWHKPEFADTWRVTNKTSLFDYAPDQSTKNFTLPPFPKDKIPSVKPENEALAKQVCNGITSTNLLKDCLFDVAVTGDPTFAKSARVLQVIQRGATHTSVTVSRPSSRVREDVTFTATVVPHEQGGSIPTGVVRFIIDGHELSKPIALDQQGQARWETKRLLIGHHRVSARFIPDKDSEFLSSRSLDARHTVESGYQRYEP